MEGPRCEKHGTLIWPEYGCVCCQLDTTCAQLGDNCTCRTSATCPQHLEEADLTLEPTKFGSQT
jgi:hypothetical protein